MDVLVAKESALVGETIEMRAMSRAEHDEAQTTELLGTTSVDDGAAAVDASHKPRVVSEVNEERADLMQSGAVAHQSVLMSLLRDRVVRIVILLFSLFSFSSTASDEMYSLFAATPYSLGGLGWTQFQSAYWFD